MNYNDIFDNFDNIVNNIKKHEEIEMIKTCNGYYKKTNIPEDMPVTQRNYYVEAAGQLCPNCFYDSYHPDTPEDIAGRALSDVQIHDVFKNPWDKE